MKRLFFPILLSGALLMTACAETTTSIPSADAVTGQPVSVDGGTYTNLSVPEMQALLADKDFTFVNAHVPFEGDIPGTDVSIPYNEIDQHLDQLPADKDARIVLYCRSGRMSEMAAETLVGLGYTNVWNLDGGMVAWEQAGLEIVGR